MMVVLVAMTRNGGEEIGDSGSSNGETRGCKVKIGDDGRLASSNGCKLWQKWW